MASQQKKVQKVVFVRHGVARHNLNDPLTGQPPILEDPAWMDPPLVYQGKAQALEAGERLRIWWRTTQGGEKLELIFTSPLTRCIQTTMYGFLPGDAYTDSRKEPTIVCSEMVREAYGMVRSLEVPFISTE
jgi:bisphosphoglycerate-dependent phosphoglycerate mutase